MPSNRKPGPTIPLLNDAPLKSVPLFRPCTSSAVLSPDHQLTRPGGGCRQVCGQPLDKTATSLEALFATATSAMPSPLKSLTAGLIGMDPTAKFTGSLKVPSPLPRRMERFAELIFDTARSMM